MNKYNINSITPAYTQVIEKLIAHPQGPAFASLSGPPLQLSLWRRKECSYGLFKRIGLHIENLKSSLHSSHQGKKRECSEISYFFCILSAVLMASFYKCFFPPSILLLGEFNFFIKYLIFSKYRVLSLEFGGFLTPNFISVPIG